MPPTMTGPILCPAPVTPTATPMAETTCLDIPPHRCFQSSGCHTKFRRNESRETNSGGNLVPALFGCCKDQYVERPTAVYLNTKAFKIAFATFHFLGSALPSAPSSGTSSLFSLSGRQISHEYLALFYSSVWHLVRHLKDLWPSRCI